MNTHFGKFLESPVFSKLFLIVYILFTGFAAYETNSAFCFLLRREHLYGVVYILFTVIAFLIIRQSKRRHAGKFYAKTIGFLSMGYMYYLLLLLAWDAVCLILQLGLNIKAVGIAAMLFVTAMIVLYGFLHTKQIATKKYMLTLGDSGEEYRLVMFSDIHMGSFVRERHIGRMVKRINALSPDLVVIAGDLFDTDNGILCEPDELKKISKKLRRIQAKNGVYAVMGNHDPKVTDKTMLRFLKAAHIKLLDNEVTALPQLNLVGRTDAGNNYREPLERLLAKADPNKPLVVVDHNPVGIDEAAEMGADLVLCGHTHRGQFFPVTIFTKWANGKHYFYGHELFGKTHAIISSGVGFFQLPVRIGTSNEIVDIRLQL